MGETKENHLPAGRWSGRFPAARGLLVRCIWHWPVAPVHLIPAPRTGAPVTAVFNHTIIASTDRERSAAWYRDFLEAQDAPSWGLFTNLLIGAGVLLQFAEPPVEIQMQHYAFLVDDEHFDRAYGKLVERGIEHWADPRRRQPDRWNTDHGGRGVYVMDPAGHGIELLTRPYL